MSSVIHSITNSGVNLKHNLQWFKDQNIIQPLASFHASIRGRETQLDDWHKSQKELFKKLFIESFKEEQRDLLVARQTEKELKLQGEGVSQKDIKKQLSKLKVESFHDEKSQVTVTRFLGFVKREVDKEMIAYNKDQKKEGWFFKYKLVRHGHPIRLLSEPFFQTTDETVMISWANFKTDVFYKYIYEREGFLKEAKRQKTILKLLERAWTQLKKEHDDAGVTYDALKARLQSFDHGLDAEFFKQDFWIEKGDHVLVSDEDFVKFKEVDAKITIGSAEAYRLLRDLDDEVEFKDITRDDVKLGQQGLQHDYEVEISKKSRNNSRRNSKSQISLTHVSNTEEDAKDDPTEVEHSQVVPSESVNPDATAVVATTYTFPAAESTSDSDTGTGSVAGAPLEPQANKPGIFGRVVSALKRVGSRKSLSRKSSISSGKASSISSADEAELKEDSVDAAASVPIAAAVDPNADTDPADAANDDESVEDNEDSDAKNQSLEILELNEDLELYGGLKESDLTHNTIKLLFSEIQKSLEGLADPSAEFIQKLLLKTKSRVPQLLEIAEEELKTLKRLARSKTSGLRKLLNKAKVIEERRKEFDAKIVQIELDLQTLRDDVKSLLKYLEYLYRKSLHHLKSKHSWEEMVRETGSWLDICKASDDAPDVGLGGGLSSQISRSKSQKIDHLIEKADVVVLKVTLEDPANFELKLAQINIDFKSEEWKTWTLVPDLIDWTSQLPPVCAADLTYPSCIESICLIKEWQNFSQGCFVKDQLSREFLCDKLGARHHKATTAVNECVSIAVWDALLELKIHGLPTIKQYENYANIIKSKTGHWLHEARARFEISCAKHRIDRVRILNSIHDMQLCLAQFGPLLCSIPVYNNSRTNFWVSDETHTELKGYCTLVLCRSQASLKTFTLRNTCGADYGDYGFVHVSYDDVIKYKFKVILCTDIGETSAEASFGTRAGVSAGVSANQVSEVAESVSQVAQVVADLTQPATAASHRPPCIEDVQIREAKKHAVHQIVGKFSSHAFEILPIPFIEKWIEPRQKETKYKLKTTACGSFLFGFAGTGPNVQAWDPDIAGWFAFLSQKATYVCESDSIDVMDMHIDTTSQRWHTYHFQHLIHIPILVQVKWSKCPQKSMCLNGLLTVDYKNKSVCISHL